jgi:hypothetical protein
MPFLFVGLFFIGFSFANSGYGSEGKQTLTYWIIAVALWLSIVILANTMFC